MSTSLNKIYKTLQDNFSKIETTQHNKTKSLEAREALSRLKSSAKMAFLGCGSWSSAKNTQLIYKITTRETRETRV